MASFLDNAVERITIETEWLPPIVVEKPFDSSAPPSAATRFLKPRITIYNPYAGPVVMAPAGQPMNNWPYLKVIMGLTALLASVTVWDFLKGRHSKKARAGLKGMPRSAGNWLLIEDEDGSLRIMKRARYDEIKRPGLVAIADFDRKAAAASARRIMSARRSVLYRPRDYVD